VRTGGGSKHTQLDWFLLLLFEQIFVRASFASRPLESLPLMPMELLETACCAPVATSGMHSRGRLRYAGNITSSQQLDAEFETSLFVLESLSSQARASCSAI
jgi:hypothetical protein